MSHIVRPNPMKAAPIITLPTAIARRVRIELEATPPWDSERRALSHVVSAQLYPGTHHTLTLAPTELREVLAVLLEIAIDLHHGLAKASDYGFTLADVQYVIDAHEHHYPPMCGC